MLDIGGGTVARPDCSGGTWEAVVERLARQPLPRQSHSSPGPHRRQGNENPRCARRMTAMLERTPTPEELAERLG